MNYSFEYIDIILLAMIAGFIFLRLRGILGKRTGFEGKPSAQFQEVLKNVKLEKNINTNFNYKTAIFIGLFQVLSLVPGVSRSGISITAARFLNFKRFDAAKISFLLSIPTLGAVSLFGLKNLVESQEISISFLNLVSILLSYIFSLVTINYFLKYIVNFNLNIFVIYRILLGLILLIVAYL